MSSKHYPDYPVLIIDDEEHVVASQEDVLKSHGIINLISTTDSREVAGILSGNEVELVLLDLRMPHVQGEEILALIRDESLASMAPATRRPLLARMTSSAASSREVLNATSPAQSWQIRS